MKRTLVAIVLLSSLVAVVTAGVLQAPEGDPKVIELLSGVTYSPNKSSIDRILGSDAADDLVAIAQDEETADPGLRIRAFRALGHYGASDEVAAVQVALSDSFRDLVAKDSGVELLYLRACAISLARVGGELHVTDLIELLDHPSRDIRAAGAQALAITGSNTAIDPLRARSLIESEPQVQLAISEALLQIEGLVIELQR